jgi:toxin ParE1/3/4
MNSYQLVISPAALDDLQGIYQFGLRKWGQTQSSQYLDHLKAQFWVLTEQPLMGIERPELLPGMRSFSVESHVMFYRVQSMQIEIFRVLHSRQDPNRRLA